MEYNYQKEVSTDNLYREIAAAGLPAPINIDVEGLDVTINFDVNLDASQESSLDSVIANHVAVTTTEQLTRFLEDEVAPFRKKLVNSFAAENISLGITQAGKSDDVLSIFIKHYDINGTGRAVSLKNALDTGSLYVAIDVIQYVRNNPSEYSGLSPFVTDARLLKLKNDIEEFLGLPLTP